MTQVLSLTLALGVGGAAALLLLLLSRRGGVPTMTVGDAEPLEPESRALAVGLLALTMLVGLILIWSCGAALLDLGGLLWGAAILAMTALALIAIRWPDWL